MKAFKFILTICIVSLMLSCNEGEQITQNQNSEILNDLSTQQVNTLKQTISSKIGDTNVDVSEILNIREIGDVEIVTFLSNNKKREIGFGRLFEQDGKTLSRDPEYTVYCTGDCDCGLEGVLDMEDGIIYVQCKCTDCQMHYEGNEPEISSKTLSMNELASKSFFNTFGTKSENIKITKVKSSNYAKADVLTVYYKGDNSDESTFMVLTNNKYESLHYNGQQHFVENGGDFIVDCTGSCDCRERFYPEDGSIECTCSPCKMEVTEVEENISE